MNCLPERMATLRAVETRLRALPCVAGVDRLSPADSPRDQAELELVVEVTPRGTIPPAVTNAVFFADVELALVRPHNHPDFRHVVVR